MSHTSPAVEACESSADDKTLQTLTDVAALRGWNEVNPAVSLRYPFDAMSMSWWDEYIHTVPAATRETTMLRVLDCLMDHTVLNEDFQLEAAVRHILSKPRRWSSHVPEKLVQYFDIVNQIFKTFCLLCKIPSLDVNGRRILVGLLDTNVRETEKAALAYADTTALPIVSQAAEAVLNRTRGFDNIDRPDVIKHYISIINLLKAYYFTISTKSGLSQLVRRDSSFRGTFHCGSNCFCHTYLRSGPTIFLRDMEKAKVIDCLLYPAVVETDGFMRGVVSDLLSNHCRDFLDNPSLDDIGRFIHNGTFFYTRVVVFEVLQLMDQLIEMHKASSTPKRKECEGKFDRILLMLVWVQETLKAMDDTEDLVSKVTHAVAGTHSSYECFATKEFALDMDPVRDLVVGIFWDLCIPTRLLAVHSCSQRIGRHKDIHCANKSCPGREKTIYLCKNCQAVYYCSVPCQMHDAKYHLLQCCEIASRMGDPGTAESRMVEAPRIMPRI